MPRLAAIDAGVLAARTIPGLMSRATPTAAPTAVAGQFLAAAASQPALDLDDATVRALFVAVDPVTALAQGQEDGVMAVRSMSTNRGGLRLLESTTTPTPTPTPSPTHQKGPLKPLTYRVAAGDTLLGIAHRFGITPETILWANDLGNGEMLQIGQDLTILPVSGVLHKVQKGDTVLTIAEAYGADSAKVVEANLMGNVNVLQEGQLLVVPGGMLRTTEPITGLPSAPSQQELAKAPRYVVKEGDNLLSIADAFGVRASVIQVANDLLDPDRLKIGQELVIPGGNPPPAAAAPKPATPTPKPVAAAPAPPKPTARPAAPEPTKPAPTPAPTPTPKPAPQPVPQPAPAPVPAGGGGDRIAAISQKYLGYRYVWGGHAPSGFDCSGFTWYVYKEAGINIPLHDLAGQLSAGPRINRDQLLPGDLVFFQNTYKAGLSHSGIYLGGGRFINAETERAGVQIRSLSDPYWSPRFVGGSRPWK
ncbi:MAG: LysM peptidoglycan-binding domain-containing protein [Chloroflexota bacterium]